jgi:hypothetical protein
MNTVLPLLLVAAALGTVLVLAGRESLRHRGAPVPPVRRPDQVLLLMGAGARALHRVSTAVVASRPE